MSLPWIKVFADLPEHPKSLDLCDALDEPLAWAYMVRLWGWCSRFAQDGRVSVARVEHAAGWHGKRGVFLDAAVAAGFIDRDPADQDYVFAHDWDVTQRAHLDKSERDRERQSQKRRATIARQSREPRAFVAGERRERGEGEGEKEKPLSAGADADGLGARFVEAWNSLTPSSIPKIAKLTQPRAAKVTARAAEHGGIEGLVALIRRASQAPLLRGEKSDWRMGPDWFLEPKNLLKVAEGNYDDHRPPPAVNRELLVGRGGDGPPPPVDPDSWLITEPLPDEVA